MSLPQFLLFAAFSLKNGSAHQLASVTAYVSGSVLATVWIVEQCEATSQWRLRWYVGGLAATGVVGTLATATILDTNMVRPLLSRLAGPPTAANALPMRKFDPTLPAAGLALPWRTD